MNRSIGIGLGMMVAILLLSTSFLFANSQDLEQDIRNNEADYERNINSMNDDINDMIKEHNNYVNILLYDLEHYECPEEDPEIIYINETEYIYENIYLDNTHCDVTGDGIVDYNDVCAVLHYVNSGLRPAQEIFYGRYPNGWDILYDVNRNGIVNVEDVEIVMEYSDMIW